MTENKIKIGQVRHYRNTDCNYTVLSGSKNRWQIGWHSPDGTAKPSSGEVWSDDELLTDPIVSVASREDFQDSLGAKAAAWLRGVAEMLEQKAAAYGDSAGNPMRIFTTASPIDMLLIRAEDKLSRLVRGSAAGEDTVADLVGYLALLAAAGWKGKEK